MMVNKDQDNVPSKKRIFCNQCKGITNHTLKGSHHREYHEEQPDGSLGFWHESDYMFWICAGCDTAVLEERWTDAGMFDQYSSDFFPKQSIRHQPTKYFIKLPSKLQSIYKETIQAFNEKMYILASAGLRALIEGICSDKHISGKNLEERINNLNALLPQNIVANLHSFRFIGNEAVHELAIPKTNDLRLAIEVSEDLLNFLYELDYKSSRLPKAKTPPQQKAG